MTLRDLERKSKALEALRASWAAAILPVVEAKVDDAHAHAGKAITDTLKATEDGRATARKASRSPSFQAALNRLDELWTWLAGPSKDSLQGKIRDAREAFYRKGFELQRPLIPDDLWITADPRPTAEGIRLIRGALIHGYDLRRELEGAFTTAKRGLSAAVAVAGRREADGATKTDLLGAWKRTTLDALRLAVLRALSDSVEFADVEAGVDLIHPEFLESA